jgi:hypothetical protein
MEGLLCSQNFAKAKARLQQPLRSRTLGTFDDS